MVLLPTFAQVHTNIDTSFERCNRCEYFKRINAYLPVENNEQKNKVAKLRTKNKTIRGEVILVFKDKW